MFSKILIANRGEIACRIIRTAKRLGIKTVAVYSEVEAQAMHVQAADEAYLLGPAPSQQSYLCGDRILRIAQQTGAQAIHPGYGFLSENAEFAKACAKANIVFMGPSPEALAAMGSKSAAKAIMEKAKVPTVPGYHGEQQDADYLAKQAETIGYPVLLKASAGGGGKGMRIVNNAGEFSAALASAKREALASFADDSMLIEKYLAKPRHIELQIFADSHGNVVHLFDRDCSIQRRHQKIIEEAPAPNISDKTRQAMAKAAVAAARAINYVGAGTIEFLLDSDEQFYFMEMNTRLQVEHPITEMITGVDLVEWQCLVAAGQPLPLEQASIKASGHAIEARVYAEDAYHDFLPSVGKITHLTTPTTNDHIRIDTGVRAGDVISIHYDPMIAKVIAFGNDRQQASARLYAALRNYHLVGPLNNIDFLANILASPAFLAVDLSTRFLLENPIREHSVDNQDIALVSLFNWLSQDNAQSSSPWQRANHWRMNLPALQSFTYQIDDDDYVVHVEMLGDGFNITFPDTSTMIAKAKLAGNTITAELNDTLYQATIIETDKRYHVFSQNKQVTIKRYDPHSQYQANEQAHHHLAAPMPGTVVAVHVEDGKAVSRGDGLLTIEAMKMEHTIYAPADGIVTAVHFAVGAQVNEGDELIGFE